MSFKLFDHQEKSVNLSLKNPYTILSLDVGMGKTLTALTVAIKSNSNKILIICPAYLRFTWQKEIEKFYPQLRSEIIDSKYSIDSLKNVECVIISYNFVEKAESLFDWADMLICDESHNLKNPKAKRTELVHRYVYEYSLPRVQLLTGTPIQNRVWEFYSLIALCNYNPAIEESAFLKRFPTYVDFANQFSNRIEFEMMRGNKRIKVVNWEGFKNVDELKTWLKGIYIRYKADNSSKVYKDVFISESTNQSLLNAFNEAQAEGMDRIKPDIKAKAALQKTAFTVQYVKGLLDEEVNKVLVYTDHVLSAEALAKGLGVDKPVTGSMSMKDRQRLLEGFQNGKDQILVATIGSFSTGITLTACHNTVFNDLSWVPSNLIQAEARTFRIGQTKTCVFHRIHGSITDHFINSKLQEKNETIKKVV